ncbi:hypothetical protein NBRC111894_1008 [Sporolactobacillus inulinus]|uniref:Uncharacterized protein n=1 Tax=Sporolactobacillus inulinus TaxID=2078 RepID=A0A4Y1Z8Y9_9BACL|nr:hypothetical protein NBRC111894_1008 [Sporolactobacillus inulinus]
MLKKWFGEDVDVSKFDGLLLSSLNLTNLFFRDIHSEINI